MCVFLGCKTPILLRPIPSSIGFSVVGECYIHGLDNNVAILGPLPVDVRVQFDKSSSGYGAIHIYKNLSTRKILTDDPRLQPISQIGWQRLDLRERTIDDPALFHCYKNRTTGQILDSDPRLLPDALESRNGTVLNVFELH